MEWIQDLISGIGDAIGKALSSTWMSVSDTIWEKFMGFMYSMIYQSLADFFSMMTEIGANLFDLDWVKAALHFFNLFGWGLFIAGLVVAIFDTAIEYQTMGRLNIKKQVLPFLYGLLAVNLFTTVPVELFRFSVNLQNTFVKDLAMRSRTAAVDQHGYGTLKSSPITKKAPAPRVPFGWSGIVFSWIFGIFILRADNSPFFGERMLGENRET